MRIAAINTNQNYQSNTKQSRLKNNFKGKLIVSGCLSEAGELLFEKVEKPLVAIVGTMPCDILIHEAATVTQDMKPVIALVEPQKKNVENAVHLILEDINDKFLNQVNIEEMKKTLAEIAEKSKATVLETRQKKPHIKHYVPKSIGKIQKPYVAKPYINQVKNN